MKKICLLLLSVVLMVSSLNYTYADSQTVDVAYLTVEAGVTQPQNFVATCKSKNSIQLKWKKTKGAKGYKIYRYNSKKNKFVKIKVIKKKSKTSWINKKLKKGKVYKYKIAAYKVKKKKTINSKKSYMVSARTYGKNSKIVNAESVKCDTYVGLTIGRKHKLETTIIGDSRVKRADKKILSNKIVWTSTNENIVKVASDGTIQALGKEGRCFVNLRLHNGKTTSVKVYVDDFSNPPYFENYDKNMTSLDLLLTTYKNDICSVARFFSLLNDKVEPGYIELDESGKIVYSNDIGDHKAIDKNIERLMNDYPWPLRIKYRGLGNVDFIIIYNQGVASGYYEISYFLGNGNLSSSSRIAPGWHAVLYRTPRFDLLPEETEGEIPIF